MELTPTIHILGTIWATLVTGWIVYLYYRISRLKKELKEKEPVSKKVLSRYDNPIVEWRCPAGDPYKHIFIQADGSEIEIRMPPEVEIPNIVSPKSQAEIRKLLGLINPADNKTILGYRKIDEHTYILQRYNGEEIEVSIPEN